MRYCTLLLTLALCGAAAVSADHYAVVVVGSHGFQNYRHHADGCHAFHSLVKSGIKAENIIVMIYDDVANSWRNPFKGQLFNQPTDGPGVDVYAGCQKDYVGGDVTAKNFLSIITGDADAVKGKGVNGTGRVLKSGADDRVFINFVDHGGSGLIAFPNPPYLYANDLQGAINKMSQNKMFKELVFYMEACESGSMFEGATLPDNVYVTTAANAQESSWGTYCPPNDKVNGKSIGSCLGDLYSVNWMQDLDAANIKKETLETQYNNVKNLTSKSHVMQYGDVQNMQDEPIGNFEGDLDDVVVSLATAKVDEPSEVRDVSAVDSRDITLVSHFQNYLRTGSYSDAKALIEEVESRTREDARFSALVSLVLGEGRVKDMLTTTRHAPKSTDCHKTVNAAIHERCEGSYTDYSLKYARTVVNMCEELSGNSKPIVAAVKKVCA